MPLPPSDTCTTTVRSVLPRRAVTDTVPAPCLVELSSSTLSTSRSRPGVARAHSPSGTRSRSDRLWRFNTGRHSSATSPSSAERSIGSAPTSLAARAAASSSSSTAASRSACSWAVPAASETSGAGCVVRGSSRSCSAVSRLRSWWDTSPTSCRSRCSSWASAVAEVSSASATMSSSATLYRRWSGRKSPPPSRAARSATCRSGRASLRAVTVATTVPVPTDSTTSSSTAAATCVCWVRIGCAGTASRTVPFCAIGTVSTTTSSPSGGP